MKDINFGKTKKSRLKYNRE